MKSREGGFWWETIADPRPTPDQIAGERESEQSASVEIRALRAVLIKLKLRKAHYYEVIVEFLDSGGTYHGFFEDVSKRLRISRPAVKWRLVQGFKWIKRELEKELGKEDE